MERRPFGPILLPQFSRKNWRLRGFSKNTWVVRSRFLKQKCQSAGLFYECSQASEETGHRTPVDSKKLFLVKDIVGDRVCQSN